MSCRRRFLTHVLYLKRQGRRVKKHYITFRSLGSSIFLLHELLITGLKLYLLLYFWFSTCQRFFHNNFYPTPSMLLPDGKGGTSDRRWSPMRSASLCPLGISELIVRKLKLWYMGNSPVAKKNALSCVRLALFLKVTV